jgi:hypothetical protein
VLPAPTQAFTLTVTDLPAFTSASSTAFSVGAAGSFTVTTTPGFPTATTLTEAGALPTGVSFTDNGNGTATLAGTPAVGTGGSYALTFTATNTAGHRDQAFTLSVQDSPVITSGNATTFTKGTAGTFTVTTAGGFPAPPALSETGALPAGVTFVDNHNGTATLAGTPTVSGVFALTIKASNGASTDATQAFTLTVNGPPSITSANSTTFAQNQAGTFTVTTTPGTPASTTITESGALPAGVTFVDNHNGTATLAGTPTASGTFALTITASNTVSPNAVQSFTLTVTPASTGLPHFPPAPNALLHGVPLVSVAGKTLTVSGSGCAAHATVTIGYYPGPVVLTTVQADSSGKFSTNIKVPSKLGVDLFIAACNNSKGKAYYLEAVSLVVPAPHNTHGSSGGEQVASDGVTLPLTGPKADVRATAAFGLAAVLSGWMLIMATRRRRPEQG